MAAVPQYHFGYPVGTLTVPQLLANKARRNGDRVWLSFLPDGRTLSYRDLDRLSNRCANGLLQRGIGPGHHVAVWMDNSPEMLLVLFALGKLGAVAVPLNTAARGQLLHHYLDHADVTTVVADRPLEERLLEVAGMLPGLHTVILHGAAGPHTPALPQTLRLCELADVFDAADAPPGIDVAASDLAYLMFTSGTTGPSKANMLAQSTAWSWGMSTAQSYGYRDTDTAYVCLPLFHAAALQCVTYATLVSDASMVLTRKFSASRFWDEVRASRATVLGVLGSMANYLWGQPPDSRDRDHPVRICNVSPMPRFGREFEARFGCRLASSYALTDYCMATVFTPLDPAAKLGSAGRPRAGVEVRIVDEHDGDAAPGAVGEIVLRSNNPGGTSLGYYKNPQATLAAWRNFWFHTGDRGCLDAEGYLHFVDRQKDAIRRKGENISAFEVEQIIDGHPAVMACAAYAAPSDTSEDEVAVSVVLKHGHRLDEPELVAYCRRNMAAYMVPRYVRFRAELPRTPSEKIEKFKLREEVRADRSAYWDRDSERESEPG